MQKQERIENKVPRAYSAPLELDATGRHDAKPTVSVDTMVLIDAMMCKESLMYCKKVARKNKFRVSSIVINEAIRRLHKIPFNYSENEARKAVIDVVEKLHMDIVESCEEDFEYGDELVEKYSHDDGIDCHHPDSDIIANSKRIGTDFILTRDRCLQFIAEREGVKTRCFPSVETLVCQRNLHDLYQHGRWSNA